MEHAYLTLDFSGTHLSQYAARNIRVRCFHFQRFTRRRVRCLHAEGWKEGREKMSVCFPSWKLWAVRGLSFLQYYNDSIGDLVDLPALFGIRLFFSLLSHLSFTLCFLVFPACVHTRARTHTERERAGMKWEFISLILHQLLWAACLSAVLLNTHAHTCSLHLTTWAWIFIRSSW